MKKLLPFLLLLLFFGSEKVYSQKLKSFTPDSVIFNQELARFMIQVRTDDHKDKAEELLLEFNAIWNGGVLSDNQREQFYNNCNLLLERRLKQFPYFYTYIETSLLYLKTQKSESSFVDWQKSIGDIIKLTRTKPLIQYFKTTKGIINEKVLYRTSGFKWKVTSDTFNFVYDSIPYFDFGETNLICRIKKDSAIITDLKGRYYPTKIEWVGENGRIDWSRAGWSSDSVYAILPPLYKFSIKKSSYTIDTVNFYHKHYFGEPLVGDLTDKVIAISNLEYIRFPRFDSYQKRLQINSIYPNVDYEGGFRIEGFRIVGFGDKYDDATFTFYKNNEVSLLTKGNEFVIRKDRVSGKDAQVSLYIDEDSIFHAGLQFKYLVEANEVNMRRDSQNGTAKSPFHNTYHNIDMYCETAIWGLNDTSINFQQIRGVGSNSKASFESTSFYSKQLFDRIQGIDETHPLAAVNGYFRKFDTKEFILEDLQLFLRKSPVQVERMLIELANLGFVLYDVDDKTVVILDKLFDYLLAKGGLIDYDVMKFESNTHSNTPNASLNYYTNDLYIKGVPEIILSDSQQVNIFPRAQQLIMKKNRDFLFSGRVHAGLFDIYGDSCSFDYNKFNLNLPNIDSVVFSVKQLEVEEGVQAELVKVKSTIADLSGELKIDHPNNKSGLNPSSEFPILENKNEAYVYYDHGFVHNKVYERNSFKYHVYPFIIDSLDNFSTDGIQFEGYLESGIFPDIEKPLEIMPDYSLGFSTFTPEEGYPVYGEKGQFFDSLSLSNQGVVAKGRLEYLTSISNSDSLIFFPDSMNALVDDFYLEELLGDVEYPGVQAEDVTEHWLPFSDSLMIWSNNGPFIMYENQNRLNGGLTLTPLALHGDGISEMDLSEIQSNDFVFKNMSYGADTSSVKIYSADKVETAVSFADFRTNIDFTNKIGEFKTNADDNMVYYPVIQYVSDMDNLEWLMQNNEVLMSEDIINNLLSDTLTLVEMLDVDIDGSEFISINPKQDSLRFISNQAKYNIKDNVLIANDIPYIEVADAAIFPSDDQVIIRKNALMETLMNSTIIASTENRSHIIEESNVNITNRNNYIANGYYSYNGDELETQKIYFEEIGIDTNYQTIAKATIVQNDKFMLNPFFKFKGIVSLASSNPYLNFDGGYQIKHDCENVNFSWVYFNSPLDPKDVVLPLTQNLLDLDGNKLFTGLASSTMNNNVYPLFLSAKENNTDHLIFDNIGKITYDKGTLEYKIASDRKLENFNIAEPFYRFNTERCIINGSGKVNLLENSGRFVMRGLGEFTHYLIPDSTYMRMIAPLDFHFSNSAIRILADSVRKANLKGVDVNKGEIASAIEMLLGKEAADKYKTDITLYGAPKRIPIGMDGTIVFNDIKLYWNQKTRSFISSGPLGVASIGKTHLNKYVNGWFEVVNKKTGQEVNIYFEISPQTWFYFNYSNGILQSISSDNKYNNILLNTKEDKRVLKEEEGLEAYEYIISTDQKKNQFMRKIKRFAVNVDNQ